jgi:hypothetical protein
VLAAALDQAEHRHIPEDGRATETEYDLMAIREREEFRKPIP